jgi:hypothetical protein
LFMTPNPGKLPAMKLRMFEKWGFKSIHSSLGLRIPMSFELFPK